MDFLFLPLLGIFLIFSLGCALTIAYVVLSWIGSFAKLLVKEWHRQRSFQSVR